MTIAGLACLSARSSVRERPRGEDRPAAMGGEEDSLRSPTVRTATAGDEAAAIATIVLAFAADPVARWPWPHAQDYLAGMPGFVRAFGGNAFAQGGAWCTEDCVGAALWLPPGIRPDEEKMGELLESTVSPSLRGDIAAAFEQMARSAGFPTVEFASPRPEHNPQYVGGDRAVLFAS